MLIQRIRASSYFKDIAWLSSGNMIGHLLSLATMPILARLYSPHSFGLASVFISILNFAVVIFGFRYEMLLQLAKTRQVAQALVVFVLLVGLTWTLLSLAFIFLAGSSLANTLGSPELSPWLWLAPFSAYATVIATALQNLLQRDGLFKTTSVSIILGKFSSTATQLGGYWVLPFHGGLVAAGLCGALGQIAAMLPRIDVKDLFKNSSAVFRTARGFVGYSKSFLLSHLLLTITTGLPNFFIASKYGSEALGHFAVALQLVFLPSALLGSSIGAVFFQRANEYARMGMNVVPVWKKTVASSFFIGIPLFAAIAFAAAWALPLLLGPNWVESGRIAVLLTIPAFFSFATGTVSSTCLVAGSTWYGPTWHASRALTIGGLILFTRKFDLSFEHFLWVFVFQASLLYLIDLCFEWRFALTASKMNICEDANHMDDTVRKPLTMDESKREKV